MLENLYTTKMSANKRQLQNRFTKIRRGSGRISKFMTSVITAAIAVTMLFATIVMAAVSVRDEKAKMSVSVKKSVAKVEAKSAGGNESTSGANDIYKKVTFENAAVADDYSDFEQDVATDENPVKTNEIVAAQTKNIKSVNDISSDRTQAVADENGTVSVEIVSESDNLYDVYIYDFETNEFADQVTLLSNSGNVYSFTELVPGKKYCVTVKSKTQNDWDIKGKYIIY